MAMREAGLTVETIVRDGNPRSASVAEVRERDADLIAVGSYSYRGLKGFISGGVVRAVLNHAPYSVEVSLSKEASRVR